MHYDLDRLFKRREIGELCHKALADGPMDTRQLALARIEAKGLDASDWAFVNHSCLPDRPGLADAGETRRHEARRQEWQRPNLVAGRVDKTYKDILIWIG